MSLPLSKKDQIIKLIEEGHSSEDIALLLGVTKMQVAGVKAHLTMNNKILKEQEGDPVSQTPNGEYNDLKQATMLDEGFIDLYNGDHKWSIFVGTDISNQKKVYWNIDPDTGNANPHMLVVGETGFGKTYATQCLIAELKRKGISTIIFDYGQGFGVNEASKDFINAIKPTQIEASKNGIAINPLQIFPEDTSGPLNVAQRVADSFCRIYPRMGIQQKEAIIESIIESFLLKTILPNEPSTWNKPLPQLNQIHNNLRLMSETDDNPMRIPAKTAYSHIHSFFRFNVIRDEGEELKWSQLEDDRGAAWILQLKGLDQHVSMVITEMLLWNLVHYLQSRGPSALKFLLVLDEAHKLSFNPGTPVDWLLREGRKFGIGVILASQQLEDYSDVALSNTATKLVFQTNDKNSILSKFLAKKCKNMPNYNKIASIITTLKRGNCFILSENYGTILTVNSINDRGSWNGN